MDDRRQDGPGQHAQHRVFEQDEHLLEGGDVPQAGNGAGHGLHAVHQGGEAQQDHPCVLFFRVLDKHIEDDPDKGQHRCEGGGLQQPDQQVAAVDPREAQQPCRDGGADVGPHDHVDGLLQGHQAGIDEANHHHRGGGGALDDRGDAQSRQQSGQLSGGQLFQQDAEPSSCPALQGLPHDAHAEQEQAQAAQQGECAKNVHEIDASF